MIRLNVFIEVADANRATVVESAKELIAATLKEDGCIAYDLFESATRPNVLMFCETWKDAVSLEVHEKTEHFTRLFVPLKDKITAKIEKFEF